jgi:sugar-specific transcriptional regulator TrmB
MLTDTTAVRTYFAKLGLEPEIADIYLALHAHGPQTLSELSRSSKVERTRIYRLIDRLMEANLIEVESHYKRGVIKAAPITNLHILISQREQELKSLQDELELVEQVLARNSLSSPATRVQFYRGPEGYKQMIWNETKAKSEVQCIVHSIIQPKTNVAFFEKYATKSNENGVHYREIHGDDFRKSKAEWYATHDNTRLAHYESRYINGKDFPITHSCDVYDNVVAYFNWKDGEIFGIEIYNQQIADTQRQFFEMLWLKATPETKS